MFFYMPRIKQSRKGNNKITRAFRVINIQTEGQPQLRAEMRWLFCQTKSLKLNHSGYNGNSALKWTFNDLGTLVKGRLAKLLEKFKVSNMKMSYDTAELPSTVLLFQNYHSQSEHTEIKQQIKFYPRNSVNRFSKVFPCLPLYQCKIDSHRH